jgi:IS5 family transposase
MKQSSFDLNLITRRTRKQVFLQQMDTVVPWAALVELIAPYYSDGRNGRPPFPLETMLRVHFIQQWFSLSDPAMEEAFFDTPLYREFAQLGAFGRLPDESTILRFRHRLEKYKLADQILSTINELLEQRGLLLKVGTAVDATLIPAPSVLGDAGSQGAGKRKKLDKENKLSDALIDRVEKIKAGIRAKVEYPFRVIKRQFGFAKVRCLGLKKSTLQLNTLFALSNLWMVRHKLMGSLA